VVSGAVFDEERITFMEAGLIAAMVESERLMRK
jgi:hypothetical protein